MATADKILLGYGVVSVNGTPIGLTRGGSVFVTEREIGIVTGKQIGRAHV